MNKEELIKLSRENLRKSKQGSLCECYDEAFIKGYELSEKQIKEFEKENKVLAQNLEDTEILNKTYEKRFSKLEKENAELKKKLKEELKTIADKDLSFVARFDGLEKENAELRLKLEALDGETPWKDIKDKSELIGKLTKAKEIISEYINILKGDTKNWKKTQEKAEQFLKEDK